MDIRTQQLQLIKSYRLNLNSKINFLNREENSLMEHIYIDFMEPSAERISEEWNIAVGEVKTILSHLPTHTHEEFGFEELYDRVLVDREASLVSTEVPEFAREFSSNEPNFFK